MKYLIGLLTMVFFGMVTPAEGNEDLRFYGVWQSLDNEFVQIHRGEDFEMKFVRMGVIPNRALLAKGEITEVEGSSIEIQREYPMVETYESTFAFSPSGETLVIQKPNSKEAWVFHKVQ